MILSTLSFVVVLLFTSSLCQQDLKLVISDTELIYPGSYIQALYDNNDKIYLIGGYNNTYDYNTYPIMQYTISNGNLEIIGQFNKSRGSAVLTRNGDIHYLSGIQVWNGQMSAEIVKLEASDNFNHISVVNEFPSNILHYSIVMDAGENIYLFGGYDKQTKDTITKYSIESNTIHEVGRLPTNRYGTSSVLNAETNIAYIFGGYSPEAAFMDEILEYDLNTGIVSNLEVKLPAGISNTCSIWDGNNAYIIGGFGFGVKFSITRFNPLTKNITDFTFDNYPDSFLHSVGCTFVKDMNRIYIFGGGSSGLTTQIMYVELTPSDPFDCSDKEDFSTIPDSYCCNAYYLCQNGQEFQYYCDYKLQYSPTLTTCLPEEMVKCGLTYGISG